MAELKWAHPGLSRLELVDDLRIRKQLMLEGSQAVVAMPGGSGTFEELLEAITLKRLGVYLGPIVMVNTRRFASAPAWAAGALAFATQKGAAGPRR